MVVRRAALLLCLLVMAPYGSSVNYKRYSEALNNLLNDPNIKVNIITAGRAEEVNALINYNQQANQEADRCTYVLLDSYELLKNVGGDFSRLAEVEFAQFCESVIYVGEGRTKRPADHLGSALRGDTEILEQGEGNIQLPNKIQDIWYRRDTLVLLVVCEKVTKYEAEDREGAIIDALGGVETELRQGPAGSQRRERQPVGQLRNMQQPKRKTKDVLGADDYDKVGVASLVTAYTRLQTLQLKRVVVVGGGVDDY